MNTQKNNNNTIKSLIKNECANYFSDFNHILNYCCLYDKPCKFFKDENENIRCGYFEESVLPMNLELEFQYKQKRSININNSPHKCVNCQKLFFIKNKNEKYCKECKAIAKKQKNKVNMRKYRKTVSDVVKVGL